MAALDDSPLTTPPRGWRLVSVAGVTVRVRLSAFATLGALWLLLHLQVAPALTWRAWWTAPLVATVAAAAFLLSVVAHELAHALVARGLGLPVVSVSILHLGGVTQLGREPDDPRDEALIALAGPLVNILLAGLLVVTGVAVGSATVTGATLLLLASLNATIGVFNLLPGHPLDGGALVRSAAWALTGDAGRALRVSGLLGQAIGGGMVLAGVVGALPTGLLPADVAWLWLAVVGVVVAVMARVGMVHAGVRAQLAGMRARDLSRTPGFELPGRVTVGAVVACVAHADAPGLVVGPDGAALGTFGPDEMAAVPHGTWDHVTVAESMRPVEGAVDGETELLSVLGSFRRTRDSVLAVVADGRPVATLSASDVLAHLDRA